ncbi:MAG: glutathione S-transferase family protein [Candidatus Binatia bacterium]
MASELILHHYDFSCFSEKVRLVLGMKGLRWRSVSIPPILPKPDYTPLTGGYRRAPALQIGADVFCDSVRIVEELEERFAEPSIYPGPNHREQRAFTAALQGWTDSTLLRCTINYISCLHPDAPRFTAEFLADRAQLFGKSKVGLKGRETAMEYLAQLRPQLEWIGDVLSDGRPYISGAAMSLADCAVYHALWIMDQLAYERVAMIPPPIRDWMDRVASRGHGFPSPMTALEALAVAAATDPLPALPSRLLEGDPAVGTEVRITPTDTGRANPSSGVLHYIDATRAGLLHRNDRVGTVAVHFPRFRYEMRPAAGH